MRYYAPYIHRAAGLQRRRHIETAQGLKSRVMVAPRSVFPSSDPEMASQLRSERGMGGMCSSVTECRVNYARPVLQSSLEAR